MPAGFHCIEQVIAVTAVAVIASSTALAQDSSGLVLQEVVVTATKVETNVQRTGIAIQTVSDEKLEEAGITNAKDLQRIVPGLQVSQTGGGGSSFYIRGVGTSNESATSDSGLAVALDQIFYSRAYGPDLSFYDLERIEVLKGPQGTLYGRNATGGTINIVTKKPKIGDDSGSLRVELGNYASSKINAAVNVPMGSMFALRLAAQSNKHDSYSTDGYYNNANNYAGRAHLLFQPNSDFSTLVTFEQAHDGQNGLTQTPYANNQFTIGARNGAVSPAGQAYVLAAYASPANNTFANKNVTYTPISDPRSCFGGNGVGCVPANVLPDLGLWRGNKNGFNNTTIRSYRADVEWNLGFANLSVIPGYLITSYDTNFIQTLGFTYNKGESKQRSLEVRLTSAQDQAFKWITGVFYQLEKQKFLFVGGGPQRPVTGSAYTQFQQPNLRTLAEGVFAQASYDIVDSLKVTAGARYSKEDKSNSNTLNTSALYAVSAFARPNYSYVDRVAANSSATTYRLGVDWQVAQENLVYAYYATGFHAGGLEPGAPATRPICKPNPDLQLPAALTQFTQGNCDGEDSFKPEYLDAYALGSKNRFLDNRLQINAEFYYWKYQDLQISHLGWSNPAVTLLRTDNVGHAKIYGVDLDAALLITANDQLSATVNYNKSKYGTAEYLDVVVGAGTVTKRSLTGKEFLNVPHINANLDYLHKFSLSDGGSITPSVSAAYKAKVVYAYATPTIAEIHQEAYWKFDANVAYKHPGGKYEAGLFVRNMFNKTTVATTAANAEAVTGVTWALVAPPRTYGLSFGVSF